MEITVTPKKWYVVSGAAGSTISTPEGVVIATVPDGGQASFYATTYTVEASDDSTEVVEATFKYAPAKLKALGVFGRGETLPSGYLPALFLTTTAWGQGIYTNHRSINGKIVEIKGRLPSKGAIFGQRNRTTGGDYLLDFALDVANGAFFRATSGTRLVQYWNNTPGFFTGHDRVYFYDDTKYLLTVDGYSAGKENYSIKYPYADAPLALFGKNRINEDLTSYIESNAGTRVFYCKISAADGTTEANYIPAVDAYGVPCMYDKVTKQPFYNSGTGSFIVGMTAAQARRLGNLPEGGGTLTISLPSDVVDENGVLQDMAIFTALSAAAAKGWSFVLQTHDGTAVGITLPPGYMECEFLEAIGTQYIDTGCAFDNNTGIACTFIYTNSKLNMNVIAGRDDGRDNRLYSPYFGSEGSWTTGYGQYIITGIRKPNPFSTICSTSNNFKNDKKLLVQDTELYSLDADANFSCSYTLVIFGASVSGRVPNFLIGRVFEAQISQGSETVRNYTPAITPGGVPCMYDSVSGEAKLNAGAGSFICGMTAAQAVRLANLPSGGGKLTVSLPQSILNDAGEITDAAVRAALNKAADNGWNITLQYYTEQ